MRLKRMMIMLAVLLLAACPALAETTMHREVSGGAVELTDVSIGYDGVTTYDRAMPVRATVKNQGGDRTGVLAVNVYVDSEQYDRCEIPLTLPAGAERQVTIPIRSYYKQEQYTVEWVENGIVTAARTAAAGKVIDPSTLLVGLLSNDPNSLSYLNIGKSNDTLRRGEMWQTVALSAADLPTDDGLLSSFAMLVIDQFDATSLSAKQMEALGRWLNSGGILALGGGADAAFLYPAFYEWTGLTPGAVSVSEKNVLSVLAGFLKLTAEDRTIGVLLSSVKGGNPLIAAGDTPLLYRASVGNGVIYTAAFAWGDAVLAKTSFMHSFLQRLLIQDSPQIYQRHTDGELWNDDVYWDVNGFAEAVKVENRISALPLFILLIAYLLLGGVGGYFLLKKWDKREWLWGLFPAITALCIVAVALMGRSGGYAEPVAATFTHLNLDGKASPMTVAVLAVSDMEEHRISAGGQELRPVSNYSYYYFYDDDDTQKNKEPYKLRYRYDLGDERAVSLSFGAPWDVQALRTPYTAEVNGDVQAVIYPVNDGLRGRVENRSDLTLKSCAVITSFGFCSLPDLKPGESADFSLIEDPANTKKVYSDGVYVSSPQDYGYYSILAAYIYAKADYDPASEKPMSQAQQELWQEMYALMEHAFNEDDYGYYYPMSSTFFRFVAFCDDLNPVRLSLDGQEITRITHKGLVSREISYQAQGESGLLRYTAGTIQPKAAKTGTDGAPYMTDEPLETSDNYRLTDAPMFGFSIPDWENITVNALTVTAPSYYSESIDAYIYNFARKAWMSFTPGSPIEQKYLGNCVRNGTLYVRFEAGSGAESYMTIYAPVLELEGTVK